MLLVLSEWNKNVFFIISAMSSICTGPEKPVQSFLTHELNCFLLVFLTAGDWKAVNEELTVSCRYIIKNQTTGDRLNIRVVAVNAGGRSPPATLADTVLVREVVGKCSFPGSG